MTKRVKKIKDSAARYVYIILLFLIKLIPKKRGKNHLLIIKLDEIGDYTLFRNFLKYFKASQKYKNHKITLLGNIAWKQLFDEFDTATVDDVIWLRKKKFDRDLFYRLSVLKQIRFLATSDVVNCVFSRSIILDDGFAYCATGNKIAMKGDNANSGKKAKNWDKNIYDSVVDAGGPKIFEALHGQIFLEQVLQQADIPLDTSFPIDNKYVIPERPYYIFFMGTRVPSKKWPTTFFVACADYMASKYQLTPVLCGGPGEEAEAEEFMQLYKGEAMNYSGKTSLPEYITLARGAKYILSVDTGPMHLAIATGKDVIGLFSGKHYNRYAPYPADMPVCFYSIYPDAVEQMAKANDPNIYDSFLMSDDTIKTIQPDKVIYLIDKLMHK